MFDVVLPKAARALTAGGASLAASGGPGRVTPSSHRTLTSPPIA